jgi:prevent-host-death family protein
MDLQKDIKSVTYMKTRPAELIEAVNKTHRPVIITQNGEARAVVQDIVSYEATRKALLLLKILAQGDTAVRQKKMLKQSDVFAKLEKKLARRG